MELEIEVKSPQVKLEVVVELDRPIVEYRARHVGGVELEEELSTELEMVVKLGWKKR